MRWIRQLWWSKPHSFTRVWFSCGCFCGRWWSHRVFRFTAVGVCHYWISVVSHCQDFCLLTGSLFLTDLDKHSFISCRRTIGSLYSPFREPFFFFLLGFISFHVLESSDYHSQSSNVWSRRTIDRLLTLSTFR